MKKLGGALFIDRPVATTLLMLALAFCGLLALHELPVSALPDVDFPTIQVVTLYPGASSKVMGETVTAPLERQFGQMPGLDQMSSSSSAGASVITLRFGLQTSLDVAEQEVQEGINAAALFLPTDLPMPPVYNKVNPADAPILTLAVYSSSMSLPALQDLSDHRLASPLSQVTGVGMVSLEGGQKPAIRLNVHQMALSALGLTLEDLRNFVLSASVFTPKGGIDGPQQSVMFDANDQLNSAAAYRDLVVAYVHGAPVRLSDVADIENGAENFKMQAWADRHPAMILSIRRQPGVNVMATVAALRLRLQQLQLDLPASVHVQVLADRTDSVRASVRDVSFELMFAVVLVVLVILLFLKRLSVTLIPAIAVPLSLIGSLAVMYLLGMSINNLTLMAMTVATGFVVDDAIVMVENIARLCEDGRSPYQAAVQGARQMRFTILSLTISLIAVLIPLLFMQDVIGRLFREFALTLVIAIVLSALVSLSLTPMLAARLLRSSDHEPTEAPASPIWQGLLQFYDRSLQWSLSHPRTLLFLLATSLALTVLLYMAIGKGFFPTQDTALLEAVTEAPPGTSFAAMQGLQEHLDRQLEKDHDIRHLASTIGIDGMNQVLEQGRMLITLASPDQRSTLDQVEHELQHAAANTGLRLFLKPVQDISVDDAFSPSSYRLVLADLDAEELGVEAQRLLQRLRADPTFVHVRTEQAAWDPAMLIQVDRASAARLGVSMAGIDNVLYDAYGQRLISTLYTQSNQYRVVLGRAQHAADLQQSLHSLWVPGNAGPVRLDVLAHWQAAQVPQSIHRLNQFPALSLGFDLPPGVALNQALRHLQEDIQATHLPLRLTLTYQGTLRAFVAALSNQLWLLLAAVITMYMVLGILYESFIHPLTILSTLPSAALGALGILFIMQKNLDVLGIIGIILLIGIVKKNAIMMVDFALSAEREQHADPRSAIHQACLLRLRPILMTSLSALVGALPLLWGQSMGSELRQPLGMTMIGGLLFSQLLTLYTTPVLYLTLSRFHGSSRNGPA